MTIKASFLAELQRRIIKAEAALREKEEENTILHQRVQRYESRWSEYEQKMKSMEEVWQKQMNSLQSSLSIAKRTLAIDDTERQSDASVDPSWDSSSRNHNGSRWHEEISGERSGSRIQTPGCMSPTLSVISRLAEEFEQRRQIFSDDSRFLVEVKSGKAEASLDPEKELRRLKQSFELWKKDFNLRLRETKVIIHKHSSDEASREKAKKKWWVRLNSTKIL